MRKKKVEPNFLCDDVFSASCAAQRINQCYLKCYIVSDSDPESPDYKETNLKIVERLLNDMSQVTDNDREQGQLVKNYYKGLTFKILQGKVLNGFESAAMRISNSDTVDKRDISIICSLPSCYERNVKRDEATRRLDFARGGFVGKIGDKVEIDIEVVRGVFSQHYGIYFISGLTEQDQPVFFSYKQDIPMGSHIKIRGNIKAHRGNSTQLNRVKVI